MPRSISKLGQLTRIVIFVSHFVGLFSKIRPEIEWRCAKLEGGVKTRLGWRSLGHG
jgi:hypothetical protein